MKPAAWKAYLARFAEPAFDAYARGEIPPELACRLRDTVAALPRHPIANEDHAEATFWTELKPRELEQLNEENNYRAALPEAPAAELLAALKEPIAAALGSPWRVLNLRAWTTLPGAKVGPYKWHLDGDLHKICKIMVYLTPCGGALGGLELEAHGATASVTGRAGQWCVFLNSVVRHRGMPPETGERAAIEITIAPADEFDLRAQFLGHIARYPLEP